MSGGTGASGSGYPFFFCVALGRGVVEPGNAITPFHGVG
jgi:hypothetical protein